MDPSREEKAALAAEWKRAQGIGRMRRRQTTVATLAISAVGLLTLVIAFPLLVESFVVGGREGRRAGRREALLPTIVIVVGISAAKALHKRLWPKGP